MSSIKRFSLLLGFLLSTLASGQGFSPIYTCPGPYACIISSYLGLQFPDGSHQTTAATGGGGSVSVGTIDSGTASANGASVTGGSTLLMQSASATRPGLVNITSQSFKGAKTFIDGLLGNLTGNVTGTASGNALVTRLINTTSPLVGGGDLSADRTLSIPPATSSANGYLTSADWSTFNSKQASGNYITSLTGEITGTGPGASATTIANNVVTNAKAAQMAAHTFKGNNTGSTANSLDLSATQLTAELNVMSGDGGSGGLKGLVPAQSSGDASKYLTGAGTWAIPVGTGISALTGDVLASGSGSVAATVASVGGSLAADVNTATIAANAATSANTVSTIVKRDSSGDFSAGNITASLIGAASGNPPNARTISTTAPLSGGGDLSSNRTLSIPAATTSVDGYLTSVDWNTFNGKTSGGITALTGDITASGPGSAASTIANNAVTNVKIANSTIDLTSKVTGVLPNANTTAASANTASAIVSRDGSGNFTAGTITAALSGNATTATTAGTVTTNANLTGPITSVGNATSIASQTGTGTKFVVDNGPTLIAPILGTIASGDGSALTGSASSFTAGTATAANGLKSATTTVSISGATAPTSGQILTATSGSAATWQTPSGGGQSTPAASTTSQWDANVNMSANNFIAGYATTVKAGGTTTLTVSSPRLQYFTGSSAQDVVLPVASTLVLGQQFEIVDVGGSNGAVIKSSGGNVILTLPATQFARAVVTCVLTSGTTAASWDVSRSVMGTVGSTNGSLAKYATGGNGLFLNEIATSATPAASTVAQWDSNQNFSADSFIQSILQQTADVTLTVNSPQVVTFSNNNSYNVTLPVASTLATGQSFTLVALMAGGSATLTVKTSAGTTIKILGPTASAKFTCILNSGTTTASWMVSEYSIGFAGSSGNYTPTMIAAGPVGWDSNLNISASAFRPALTSTATAAGTTTLSGTSNQVQVFTGSSTQIVKLPSTNAPLSTDSSSYYDIINNSTGALTIQSSTAVALQTMSPGTWARFIALSRADNTAASWQVIYSNSNKTSQTQISRLRSAATSLTTATTVNVAQTTTKLTLPAGDWVIYGTCGFTAGASSTVSNLTCATSKTSATLPATDTTGVPTAGEYTIVETFPGLVLGGDFTLPMQPIPVSLTTSTDYYLVGQGTFGISTLSIYGSMYAVAQ